MINKVILVGNVGFDPEVRSLETGVKMARLRLATTERIRDRQTNEVRELTEWHTVVLWRSLADVADRYVHKGSQLYIEGSIHTREWTDKENQTHYSTEIVANELKLLGRRSESAGATPAAGSAPSGAGSTYGAPQQPQQPVQSAAPVQSSTPAPTPVLNKTEDVPF